MQSPNKHVLNAEIRFFMISLKMLLSTLRSIGQQNSTRVIISERRLKSCTSLKSHVCQKYLFGRGDAYLPPPRFIAFGIKLAYSEIKSSGVCTVPVTPCVARQ